MPIDKKASRCRGANYTIMLHQDKMVIGNTFLATSTAYEIPINRIKAVIVQRKNVLPFAVVTFLAALAAVIARFNALWFLINLSSPSRESIGTIALLTSGIFAVPTVARAAFVNVIVSWEGQPGSLRVRYVLGYVGRSLAARFREVSWEGK